MTNNATSLEMLEGFISKIEDFHRLMNFLEVTFQSKKALYESLLVSYFNFVKLTVNSDADVHHTISK